MSGRGGFAGGDFPGQSAPAQFSREDPVLFYFTSGVFLFVGLALLYIAAHSQYILNQRARRRRQRRDARQNLPSEDRSVQSK